MARLVHAHRPASVALARAPVLVPLLVAVVFAAAEHLRDPRELLRRAVGAADRAEPLRAEGVHLHDIVLQYLRKRLTAAEMRAEQTKVRDEAGSSKVYLICLPLRAPKVVDGMVAASEVRMAATGSGLQDTGSTAKAFAGEEVDW